MESDAVNQTEERVIKDFLDVLILAELTKGRPLGGYDVVALVQKRFGILLSPGTVYHVMHSMERKGLVASALEGGKKVYLLTGKGKETIKSFSNARQKVMNLIADLF